METTCKQENKRNCIVLSLSSRWARTVDNNNDGEGTTQRGEMVLSVIRWLGEEVSIFASQTTGRRAHSVGQSELKHAGRITAVQKGWWRAISGFATQITLNAMSVKDELRYFCKNSYNSWKMLRFKSAQKQQHCFLMLSVNTPTANKHTLVFTHVTGRRHIFNYLGPRKMAGNVLIRRTVTTNNINLNVQGCRKHHKLAEQKASRFTGCQGATTTTKSAFHFQIVWRPKSARGPEANNKDTIQYGADYANKPDQPLNANTEQNTLANNDRFPHWQKGDTHIYTRQDPHLFIPVKGTQVWVWSAQFRDKLSL